MDYVNLGKTGLKVSRLCLGCMTFGVSGKGPHDWTLDEEASRPIIRKAVELGVNFFDTANGYSSGTSEEITGRALKDFTRRDEIVLATKVYIPWRNAPNTGGLSRKAIFAAVDDSLRRLGTDYIDLYQIHRWDSDTPIEETMEALHDVVKAGKARYIGASSMYAWQFLKALYTAEKNGWTRFVSMQNHLNLLNREEEREMLPLCADQGVGVIPWSPLARGRLTRDWDDKTERSESDAFGKMIYAATADNDRQIVEAVAAVAAERGAPRAQVSLAWLLQKPEVTAPIIGASKPHHLDDAVAALALKLTPEEIARLEAPYVPHPVVGLAGAARFAGKLSPPPAA
jgi:aryl-alcohol dehydrogenase-like predicted oxidoreductase